MHYYTLLKKFKKKRPEKYYTNLYPRSVVMAYFIHKKQTYSQLNKEAI